MAQKAIDTIFLKPRFFLWRWDAHLQLENNFASSSEKVCRENENEDSTEI